MYYFRPKGHRVDGRMPPQGDIWYRIIDGRVQCAVIGSVEKGKPDWMASVEFPSPAALLTCPFIVHDVELGQKTPSDITVDIDL